MVKMCVYLNQEVGQEDEILLFPVAYFSSEGNICKCFMLKILMIIADCVNNGDNFV